MVELPFAALQYFDFEGHYALSFVVDGYAGFWAHEYYENATKRMCKGAPIMQFTGLKDKNGVDIYEGDLIRFADKYTYVVKFEDAKFVGYHANNDWGKWGDIYKLAEPEFDKYGYFVIGNIYQNKELLSA